MEDNNEVCITGLSLGLGIGGEGGGGFVAKKEKQNKKVNKLVPSLDLTFELYPKGEEEEAIDAKKNNHHHHHHHEYEADDKGFCLKRTTTEEGRHHKQTNEKSNDNTNDDKNSSRKKLRLTKEQSAMLEEKFKLHTTLNQAQKQALAEQLNLKHRQVEVWFQNRRARTKLKQTEVDCEYLKKCCEKLTDENIRLKKELQELRALRVEQPSSLYIQLSKAATLTLCSSCEELLKPNEEEEKEDHAVISDVVQSNNNHNMESSIEN